MPARFSKKGKTVSLDEFRALSITRNAMPATTVPLVSVWVHPSQPVNSELLTGIPNVIPSDGPTVSVWVLPSPGNPKLTTSEVVVAENQPETKHEEDPEVNPSQDEGDGEEEEESKLQAMAKADFSVKFKLPIQRYMNQVRQFHHTQARKLVANKAKVDETASFKERSQHALDLFYKKYKFVEQMEGFDPQPMIDVYLFIANNRISTRQTNKYHSEPKSLRRFCECRDVEDEHYYTNKPCELRRHFDWCDLHHVEDLEDGAILWTKCSSRGYDFDDYERDFHSLVMLHNMERSDYTFDTIQLSRVVELDSEAKIAKNTAWDTFRYCENEVKKADVSTTTRSTFAYETTTDAIQNSSSRFLCSLKMLSEWYRIPNLEFFHLNTLVHLGSGAKNLLNYFLSGLLSSLIYTSLGCMKTFVAVEQNHVTPKKLAKWITVHTATYVWTHLAELIVQHKHRKEVKGHNAYGGGYFRRDTFQPKTMMEYSLEELKMALECYDYIGSKDTYRTVKMPSDVPTHLSLNKNTCIQENYCSRNYDILEVLIWCIRHGGDTALIKLDETLISWCSKNK